MSIIGARPSAPPLGAGPGTLVDCLDKADH